MIVYTNSVPHATIADVIREYDAWHARNFPGAPNVHRSLLKFHEEVGELNAALYAHNRADLVDAIGDIFVSLLGVARSVGVDFEAEVIATWKQVRDRDYVKYPDGGRL